MARGDNLFDKSAKAAAIIAAKKAAETVEVLKKIKEDGERTQREEERERREFKELQIQEERRRNALIENQVENEKAYFKGLQEENKMVSKYIDMFYKIKEIDDIKAKILASLNLYYGIEECYNDIEQPDNKQKTAEIKNNLKDLINNKSAELLPEIINITAKMHENLQILDRIRKSVFSQLSAEKIEPDKIHSSVNSLIEALSTLKLNEFVQIIEKIYRYFGEKTGFSSNDMHLVSSYSKINSDILKNIIAYIINSPTISEISSTQDQLEAQQVRKAKINLISAYLNSLNKLFASDKFDKKEEIENYPYGSRISPEVLSNRDQLLGIIGSDENSASIDEFNKDFDSKIKDWEQIDRIREQLDKIKAILTF